MSNLQQNDRDLLIAGAETYPQALAALNEFRRLVVVACKQALMPELGELSKALGLPLVKSEVKDYARPESLGASKIDGDFGSLGVKIVERPSPPQSGQYCFVLWQGGKLQGVMDIWVNSKPVSLAIFEAFQKFKPAFELKEEDGEVMLMRPLQPTDMHRLAELMQELVKEWVKLWKSAGGLNRFRAKGAGK